MSALALIGSAQAAEQTFQFKSTVKQIEFQFDFDPKVELTTVTLPSGFAKLGDTIDARVTYDTSETTEVNPWGGASYRRPISSFMDMGNGSIVVGGAAEGGAVSVYDNDRYPSGDAFGSFAYFFSDDAVAKEMVAVSLEDPSGTVLNGHQLPGSELTGFQGGTFIYSYETYRTDASGTHSYLWRISGDITAIAAVPEPGTYAMLLAGLGLLGWRSRRRA